MRRCPPWRCSVSRRCLKCGTDKPAEMCGKGRRCKVCRKAYNAQYRKAHIVTAAERMSKWRSDNKDHLRAYHKERSARPHVQPRTLLFNARRRASKLGIPFSINLDDVTIPKVCPVFGVALSRNKVRGQHPWSPTLDRIVPALGYVPGNVRVISWKANRLKSDATPDELYLVAEYARRSVDAADRPTDPIDTL